jgi:hypothetical protein
VKKAIHIGRGNEKVNRNFKDNNMCERYFIKKIYNVKFQDTESKRVINYIRCRRKYMVVKEHWKSLFLNVLVANRVFDKAL